MAKGKRGRQGRDVSECGARKIKVSNKGMLGHCGVCEDLGEGCVYNGTFLRGWQPMTEVGMREMKPGGKIEKEGRCDKHRPWKEPQIKAAFKDAPEWLNKGRANRKPGKRQPGAIVSHVSMRNEGQK